MIVIHLSDPTTRFLHKIYDGIEGVRLFTSLTQKQEALKAIQAAPKDEPILLLGHGTPFGLIGNFVEYFIGDAEADLLKDHPNLIGIFCYASTFAKRHNLKGFFSGMFISEPAEAHILNVPATPQEIEQMNWTFSGKFGDLLRANTPLETIAATLKAPADQTTPLTSFNYSRLTYRNTGTEPLPEGEDYLCFNV
ncbi:MAG: hypothetical protein J6T04_03540 [Bacteroidales bacterium]|nr:hypothetical protein [Bacteroidales bacterium]